MTRTMKNSGIKWIGQIPEQWNVKPIYTTFSEVIDKNYTGDVKTALRFSFGTIIPKENFNSDEDDYVANTIKNYTVVKPGNIVINGLNLNYDFVTKRVAIVNDFGGITSAYISIKPDINKAYPKFMLYLLKSYDHCRAFHGMGEGVRKILNYSELKKNKVILPPLPEQQAIADYLDDKCAQIDNITATINEQIEVLKQYKKSVITEAVTKGLDPNVPMKDSGVDIFGKIPFSWNLIRLKYLTEITTGNMDTQDAEEDGIYPFYVRSPKVEHSNVYTFDGEGILMAGDGAGAGKVFHHAYGKFAVHQRVYIIYNFKNINSNFLFYFLENLFSEEINKGSAQSTVPSIRLYMLHNFNVCVPTIREQEAIADYLDDKCTKIDAIIADKQAQLETLAAYKKSLIYEYVTGKKSVPGFEEA